MDRRSFCTKSIFASLIGFRTSISWAGIEELKMTAKRLGSLGTHAGLVALDGKKRVLDPYRHYPSDNGVSDPITGHRFFFHAHRDQEFGHFHTFSKDQYGAPVHLVMISIDEQGQPIALSTVNQWVTGTRHIEANQMRPFIDAFSMSPSCYKQPDLVRFVTETIGSHTSEIETLFHERDAWLKQYRSKNTADPFKDKSHEILSTTIISPLQGLK